jgi:hypothetical protein
MAQVTEAHVSLEGFVLTPTRSESYDFKGGDGNRIQGTYFVTDVIQVRNGKTLIVPVRSDYPLVEEPKAGELLDFPVFWEMRRNGQPRFTYDPPAVAAPTPNGAKPTADAKS